MLGGSRNDIDPSLIWLFRPSDKYIEQIEWGERERLAEYIEEEYIDEYVEDTPFSCVMYRCTAAEARDRLELKGFTLAVAEACFNSALEENIQHYADFVGRAPDIFSGILQVLHSLSAKKWLNALAFIVEERLTEDDLDDIPNTDEQLPLLRYMLESHRREFYGCPGFDHRHFLRLLVEVVPAEEKLIYDLTDLIVGGWIDKADELVSVAERWINEDFLLSQRIIVLTEGETDKRVLERSLRLLYPHLADYFHFFNYTVGKLGGGVGEFANLVRAFAAADVRHRIIALFDNDSAAKDALSNLPSDNLPLNIAVCHYPDIAVAENYPTLGPSGNLPMNVNGMAGSIELYLGQDVLKNCMGDLAPVQWTGYNRKLEVYQGEVIHKRKIHKAFFDKLALCEAHPEKIEHYDWDGIRAILKVMFTAFHEVDAKAILSGAIYED